MAYGVCKRTKTTPNVGRYYLWGNRLMQPYSLYMHMHAGYLLVILEPVAKCVRRNALKKYTYGTQCTLRRTRSQISYVNPVGYSQ